MKRVDLIRHLESCGCRFKREGGDHSVWRNPTNGNQSAIPRHREISDILVNVICRQLEIPRP
jgi:predicted RNA binding protein YcfA (HicA-like mRNA interferase family)